MRDTRYLARKGGWGVVLVMDGTNGWIKKKKRERERERDGQRVVSMDSGVGGVGDAFLIRACDFSFLILTLSYLYNQVYRYL